VRPETLKLYIVTVLSISNTSYVMLEPVFASKPSTHVKVSAVLNY